FTSDEIRRWLDQEGHPYTHYPDSADLADEVSSLLETGSVVGLFSGRMEFGPRALGGRSIIGDPRRKDMQSVMNLKIKYRESFRPFAPACLSEHASENFDLDDESPYMLLVATVADSHRIPVDESDIHGFDRRNAIRSDLPAITHVDYTARVQTVDGEYNPLFRKILEAFYEQTGCPVLINTSFNVRGEPIVCRPSEAYTCFIETEMDALVLEDVILLKEDQPKAEHRPAKPTAFGLD
ncbi:MAG: carbamoyltransferase, partial [Rhodothermales bacterium]|nr:carbamoyltransferase [Rhodothermales bacterium]